MLTVATVCVPGGEYDQWHVARLERMVRQHLMQKFNFVTIWGSDKPGWWAKIDLFEPGRFGGRVLYLDLDVTVVGDLRDIVRFPATFGAIRDYGRLRLNSSVMVWDAGVADHVYTEWTQDVIGQMHGDQDWITVQMPQALTLPRRWVPSYKAGILKSRARMEDAKVVVFHGRPKPWEVGA